MESQSNWSEAIPPTNEVHIAKNHNDDTRSPSTPLMDYEFDESQCLFCNELSPDLDHNLTHMSNAHSFYIDPARLLVDTGSLLAYFHLVISGYYECLYCGKYRNTRQAIQQHMMAKGHCRYDITDKDSELRDFYDFSASEAEEEAQRKVLALRVSDAALQARSRKARSPRSSDPDAIETTPPPPPSTTSPPPPDDQSTSSADEDVSQPSNALSTRALKQEATFNKQLSHLRAADRKSLLHLPPSQQRTLLLAHHKQISDSARTEQTQRGRLESAGNNFGRLSSVRLVRIPPHSGRVQTLKK